MKRALFRAFPITLILVLTVFLAEAQTAIDRPIRLAVAGITHGHVPWILGRKDKSDVTLVGIFERDTQISQVYAKRFSLRAELLFSDLNKMLDSVKPEAVVAFGPVQDHLAVVEACAPRGIHVMVEKPLTTKNRDAQRMDELAKKNNIHLLTNFETSWYPTTAKAYSLAIDTGFVGRVKKVVFHHGHQGPKEIGVSPEFFNWLTDPEKNGAGALTDFGCYGANIMSYLMPGQEPISVTAITQHFKPAIYPRVDDEATIIVTYPTAQCIIQASWNWPFSRKDMEIYGDSGYIITTDNTDMRVKNNQTNGEQTLKVTTKEVPVYTDPFSYLADVVKGKIKVVANGLYSLENNIIVTKILDAAIESANTGKTVAIRK